MLGGQSDPDEPEVMTMLSSQVRPYKVLSPRTLRRRIRHAATSAMRAGKGPRWAEALTVALQGEVLEPVLTRAGVKSRDFEGASSVTDPVDGYARVWVEAFSRDGAVSVKVTAGIVRRGRALSVVGLEIARNAGA